MMGDVLSSEPEQLCIRCCQYFTPQNPKTNEDLLICVSCKSKGKPVKPEVAVGTPKNTGVRTEETV
jgi:hypothetical protein